MKKTILILFILTSFSSIGQDILGGEIITTHVSGYTYQATVSIYTKTSISGNDSTILINTLPVPVTPTFLFNNVTKWSYTFQQTFSGVGTYIISAKDSSRIANIMNITGSATETIFLQKSIIINPFIGINNSPQMLSSPIDITINAGKFIHNPIAVDSDGDSLAYSLVPASASNYSFPVGAFIDSITGIFSMPVATGAYAVAIKIDEWRSGIVIGSTVRELTIDSNLVTSVSEKQIQENITVFPNPTSTHFKINGLNKSYNLTIYNSLGQQLYSEDNASDSSKKIDVSQFKSGLIFIRIESEGEIITRKILKE